MEHFDAVMKARKLAELNREDHIVFWDDNYSVYRIAKFEVLYGPDYHDVNPTNICYSDGTYDGVPIV